LSFYDSLRSIFGITLHAGDIETMDVLMDVAPSAFSAMQQSAVHTAVKGISETGGSLPINIMKTDSKTPSVDNTHPLAYLLKHKPNKIQTPIQFIEQILGSALLRGKCPTQIIRNGFGDPVELHNLNPDRMEYGIDPLGYPIYLYKDKDNKEHAFKDEDIMMVENFLGLSPIEISSEVFNHASEQQRFASKFTSNGCRPSGILTRDKKWKDEATRSRFIESWKAAYSGPGKAGKTILLEEGMDWKSVSVNADEAQFLESRKFSKEEILSIYRYPAHLAGNMEQMKFSNVEEMYSSFMKLTMLPWLKRIEQAIQRSLFKDSEFGIYCARFNMDSLLRASSLERAQSNQILINSSQLTPNEARAQSDLPPLPGGDSLLAPLNYVPIEKLGKAVEPPENTPADDTDDMDNETEAIDAEATE
jgi:HK97 family phage portal protein